MDIIIILMGVAYLLLAALAFTMAVLASTTRPPRHMAALALAAFAVLATFAGLWCLLEQLAEASTQPEVLGLIFAR